MSPVPPRAIKDDAYNPAHDPFMTCHFSAHLHIAPYLSKDKFYAHVFDEFKTLCGYEDDRLIEQQKRTWQYKKWVLAGAMEKTTYQALPMHTAFEFLLQRVRECNLESRSYFLIQKYGRQLPGSTFSTSHNRMPHGLNTMSRHLAREEIRYRRGRLDFEHVGPLDWIRLRTEPTDHLKRIFLSEKAPHVRCESAGDAAHNRQEIALQSARPNTPTSQWSLRITSSIGGFGRNLHRSRGSRILRAEGQLPPRRFAVPAGLSAAAQNVDMEKLLELVNRVPRHRDPISLHQSQRFSHTS